MPLMHPRHGLAVTLAALAAGVFGAWQTSPALSQAIFTTVPSSLARITPGGARPSPAPAQSTQPAPAPIPALPAPAMAQDAPASMIPMPMVPAPAADAPVMPAQDAVSPLLAANAPAESGTVLRHLTNNIQGFRLAGEIGTTEWPVYLTSAQARQKLRFQVGYLTAVSVMPEASFLTLTINDTVVGRVNIRATHAVRTVSFDIPLSLMQPGFNSVRLTAEQRHRVDCSLQATYELWTQIDPAQTGIVMPRQFAGVTSLAELAALSPDAQGALPIRAVVPGRTNLANVERIMRVAQMISLVGRFEQPVVDIGPLADGEYGINLVIGTAQDVADLPGLPALGGVQGPRIIMLPPAPGRRTTVVATGRTDDDVRQALDQFDANIGLVGSPAGLRAATAFPGYRMDGGQRVSLKDLGVVSEEFGGRLFRAAFNVIMPPDFYPADYAKAILDLAGGYAPGLTTEAQMVVSINGRNAVSRKLPKSNGDVFTQAPIPLPLSAMRPGLNRVELEAQVPTASDVACDPLASIGGSNRFLFLDSTELEIPRIARIARMPDLSVTASGGFPYAGLRSNAQLIVPSPDRDTVGAAATFAARMAVAAGQPITFNLTTTMPDQWRGAALVIAPARGLDPDFFRLAGIDPADVNRAWSGAYDLREEPKDESLSRFEQSARDRLILQRNFPASCRMPKPVGGFEHADRTAWRRVDRTAVATLPTGPVSSRLFEDWTTKLNTQSSLSQTLSRYSANLKYWIGSKWFSAIETATAPFRNQKKTSRIPSRTSLFVAQNILGDTRDDVVTLVTAPNSQALATSVACLVDPRVWRQISGRLSFLDASEGTISAAPAEDPRLIVTQPLTVQNTRLIAAGWLSINNHVYVGLALAAAMLLALSTTLFVQGVGRRNG